MKKTIRCLLLAFMLTLVFCVSVAAAEQTGAQNAPYINNQENLLEKIEWCEKIAVVDPYRCREELKSLIKNLKQDIDVDSCCSDTAVWEDQ